MKSTAITQQDRFGCGVASVASLLGMDYKKAQSLFADGEHKAATSGFLCKEVVDALSRAGKHYQYRYVSVSVHPRIYEDGTIVFIRRSKKYPVGHYLCRINGQWMDSWINQQENQDIKEAASGFRKRLPGTPIYALLETKHPISRGKSRGT